MIGRAVFVLILIFVINFIFVGLGLATADELNTVSPITQDIDTITDNTNKVGVNVPESAEGGAVSDTAPQVLPDSGDMYDNYKYIKTNVGNFVWGYKNAFVNMGLPSAIVFLLTGIIAIIQIFCVFIIVSTLVSSVTGGGI